jgi:hypothetical protein
MLIVDSVVGLTKGAERERVRAVGNVELATVGDSCRMEREKRKTRKERESLNEDKKEGDGEIETDLD